MSKHESPIVMTRPVYLAKPNAAAYLAMSESLLESLVARGDAPPPRKISPGRSAWLVEELDQWARTRPVSDLLPPEGTQYGRNGKPS